MNNELKAALDAIRHKYVRLDDVQAFESDRATVEALFADAVNALDFIASHELTNGMPGPRWWCSSDDSKRRRRESALSRIAEWKRVEAETEKRMRADDPFKSIRTRSAVSPEVTK